MSRVQVVQVVENKRIDGEVRQAVIATLGRSDEFAATGALASLLASGARLCDVNRRCASVLGERKSPARYNVRRVLRRSRR